MAVLLNLLGRGKRGRRAGERGQAMVEFMLVLPIALIVLLALIQFGVVYTHYLNLTDAVRVAGRALSTCRFGGSAVGSGNGAAGSLTITWDNGNSGVAPSAANCATPAGTLLTVRGRVFNENLNVFGLFPTFKTITLSSQVTVTEE